MKAIRDFLADLSSQQVRLWADGDQLRLRAPKGVLTESVVQQIQARKPEILLFLSRDVKAVERPPVEATTRVEGEPLPLSYAQQRLWFLEQLEGASPTYNIPSTCQLTGTLQVAALQRAINEMTRRHEVLRTYFATVDGQPVQQIESHLTVPLVMVDLQHLTEVEQRDELHRLLVSEARTPFNLAEGPLLRVTLYQLGNTQHVLLLMIHHIISDGWSLGVWWQELDGLYRAFATGEPSPLPELSLQYADFARWQRSWLTGGVLESQLSYWRQHLADAPTLLELPTDYSRPPVQTFNGQVIHFEINAQLTQQLRDASLAAEATLFMTLYAAFAVLLARYSRQEDLVIGTSIANRHYQEIEPLIGFFVNTLPLRTDLSGNPTFEQLLNQVRQATLDAYAYQDIPFEHLVGELVETRNLSHPPLFQVLFEFQDAFFFPKSFGDLSLEPLDLDTVTAKFDINFVLSEGQADGCLAGLLEYNIDLFEQSTIERMIDHYLRLLGGMVQDMQQPINRLPLLSPVEKQQLLTQWNDTAVPCPSDQCFHALFEAQVERAPNAEALVYSQADQVLTYLELNERANQLAHHLRTLGVGQPAGAETMVGVCMERCPETVISLLAIFKAGGVYIPLDPALPQDRLAYMLTNAEARVVLTKSAYASRLATCEHQAQIVDFDTDGATIAEQSTQNLTDDSTPQHLAYVIYTSGSTGLPKGAMIEHQGMVNHLYTKIIDLKMSASDRLAETAPQSFDISIWQFLSALLVGGAVHIFDDDTVQNPAQLLARTEAEKITILEVVPSLFRFMLDELATTRPEFSALRWLMLTGEALPPHLCREWFPYYPGIPLMNAYGPTECSDDVTHHAIYEAPPVNAVTVPIGRAVPNMRLYILDAEMQPVPIGVLGELYVGGIGVGRGYLNDPERTAQAFMEDPFVSAAGDVPHRRFYKTGDLVRYRPDGAIEFLGRLDHQVKIRGHRIELGEIEGILAGHPAVRQSLVIAQENGPADYSLVAYAAAEAALTVSELRHYLAEKLPDYMIPAAFVTLEAFPLTPNGKIDRAALPVPEIESGQEGYVMPQTPGEEVLANVWAEVLGIGQVGREDNFFELGGHSLLAIQVISRLRDAFGVELSVRVVFESPTIAELAQAIETARQGESLLPVPAPIVPMPRDGDDHSLSFAQQRLWFLDQLEGPSATYNIGIAFRLAVSSHQNMPLQVSALEEALRQLIERHEVLRTTFPAEGGEPIQRIHLECKSPLTVIDLQPLTTAEQTAELDRLLVADAKQPFDLAQGPLLRVNLYVLSENEQVLQLTIHHIISDAWSMDIITNELRVLYQAALTEQAADLPALPVQYADFARWQRDWLSGEVLETQLAYWQAQLAHAPTLLNLPTDHPRPLVQTFHGQIERFELEADLTAQLHDLSRRLGTSSFMTYYTVFAVLMSRYSDQEDLVIGTPIANRQYQEIEPLIGFFLNTLALRTDLSGDPSFADLVGQVRQVTLDAYAHQDIPFEQLVEELAVERNLSHAPLFQVMFAWLEEPPPVRLGDMEMAPIPLPSVAAKFDLLFLLRHAEQSGEGLRGMIEYNTDLFERATIERLIGHFRQLLHSIAASPQQPVKQLPMLPEAERHQLLVEWNDTRTGYPTDLCIHHLFEQQAERTPHAVAVVFGEDALTYRALNHKANQLAHQLRVLGVGPDVLVGLCVERSLEMVVGLLGILKAGGAYVPLDPTYPQERLTFMQQDGPIKVLLTHSESAVGAIAEAQPLYLDQIGGQLAALPTENPDSGIAPEDLAYVIYTSGSTGRPKGVAIEHRNAVALLSWAQTVFSPNDLAGTLAATSICFDLSVFELFLPLSCGGTVIVVENALALPTLSADPPVTLINTVPSAMRELVRMQGVPESVGVVNLAGEPLSNRLVQDVYAPGHVQRVYNLYGPSEDTTYSTFVLCEKGAVVNPTVGRPIANTQAYILDGQMQPTPIGVPGGLYLGGDGLARGYLNQPEMTAERFIDNPFGPGRLYDTGDLARYLPDRQIEFLGRIDHQIKIRGFRIELGEIESVLGKHPSVREMVVVARDGQEHKELVAYVVPKAQASQADLIPTLRTHLKRSLPDYMVPATFVTLNELPLTPNGKIDRNALPAPERGGDETSFVSPHTPTEELVAAIWAEVLGLEQVGRDDIFFDLGGHSLLATQVISRLREAFKVALRVRTLFESPTVVALAEAIEAARQAEQQLPVPPPIQAVERAGDLPLSFAQQRLWVLSHLSNETDQRVGPREADATYNVPVLFRIYGSLNVAALENAMNEVVRRHEILRTTFFSVNGEPQQRIHPALTLFIQVSKRDDALAQAQEEAMRPFDLAAGPLLRVHLYPRSEQEYLLLINMHHIISDGWSLSVLWRELEVFYQAFASGHSASLPELDLQYADFALWQRSWLRGDVLESQLAYWQQQLADAPTVIELPTDHRRPLVQSFNGRCYEFDISPELADQLRVLSRRNGSTLFMTLYSAFSILLYRYSGQDDIVIGSPIANRHYQEIEPLIGFFVNTLALRVDLSGEPSFEELLHRVHQVTLDAYAHQDIPFEQLVSYLNIERHLSHSPLFQVMFTWQTHHLDELQLGDLRVSYIELEAVRAKFDLTLGLGERTGKESSDGGLWGVIEYNTDLFELATIERMMGHFKQLLGVIVADPAQSVNELPLLTPAERQELLAASNNQHAAYPVEKSINQLFEEQVARSPEAVAVIYGEKQLNYRELNHRANQLAHYLIKSGVGPDVLVGICVERSLDMVVGLLGALKAGGAYLPLDPDYPAERLAFMLDDARVPLLLTQQPFAERFAEQAVQRLCLDTDWPTIAAESPENPPNRLGPESLAYVIYTSGSTGRPKGVMVPHRAINRLVNHTNYVEITPQDRMAQASNASFDAATFEIWGALLHGACLVGIPREVTLSPQRLATELQAQAISILFLTTALFNQVVSFAPEAFVSLRYLLFGGEAVDPESVRKLLEHGAPEHFLHVYGPTENTTFSTWYPIDRVGDNVVTVPIGVPIANSEVYILDGELAPVPVGVPGELYLGGDGLALGYLNRPKLSEERFIPNPFSGEPSASERLYKTGDLVRYLPVSMDGLPVIEFVGRLDDQIKLRGFRIELGEIEAVLTQHPGVQETSVMLREDQPGQKQLVAYIVADQRSGETKALGANALRHFLKQKVPDYMVPGAFVFLGQLPLNANGKVDRRALPAPADIQAASHEQEHVVSPQSELEKAVASVWQELLNVPKVGIHDNFFDVGGHSLLAIQLHHTLQSRVAQAKELSVTDLFHYPTIASLAAYLSSQLGHSSQAQPVAPLLQSSQSRSQARRDALEQRAARQPSSRRRR